MVTIYPQADWSRFVFPFSGYGDWPQNTSLQQLYSNVSFLFFPYLQIHHLNPPEQNFLQTVSLPHSNTDLEISSNEGFSKPQNDLKQKHKNNFRSTFSNRLEVKINRLGLHVPKWGFKLICCKIYMYM